jgi:hypothetical protein
MTMRAVQIAILLTLCTTACGRYGFDPLDDGGDSGVVIPANIPSWTSGTRLRAKVADFGGGAIELTGWFDSELGLDCSLDGVAPDGIRHCFPAATNIVYADAGCSSQKLGIWNPGGGSPQPTYAIASQIVGNTFVKRTYPLGAEMSVGSYYSGDPGACTGPYPQTTLKLYAVGAEIDPATLVRLDDIREGTGRLRQDGWQGSDGSKFFTSLFDSTRGLSCRFQETTMGQRCVTQGDYAGLYFADAACTVPLAEPGTPGLTDGIATTDPCGPTHRYARGAPFTGTAYQLSGTTCMASTMTGLNTLGPEMDPTIFMLGNPTIGREAGRIVGNDVVALDGGRVRSNWLDTTRGNEMCGVSSGAGVGGTRCLPGPAVLALGDYGDVGCTVPIADRRGTCTVKYILEIQSPAWTVHLVDPTAAAPTQRFINASGSCLSITFDATINYVVGGPALSFDLFALATDRVE